MQNQQQDTDAPIDLIWGVTDIAKRIRRTERQTFHMLSTGQLPGKKVGGRWVSSESKLIRFFMEDAA